MMAPTTCRESPISIHVMKLTRHHDKECMLCGHKEISEKLYGPLYQINDVVVHSFCILLTPLIVICGENRKETGEFVYNDIKKKILRGSRKACDYCKKMGATIKCCEPKCKIFHLPCGLKNGSMHQFYGMYTSYCKQHRIRQVVNIKGLQSSTTVQCVICKDVVKTNPSPSILLAPCCKRNSWFHRDCIQGLALSAGELFKCPLCNNVETFKDGMLYLGIYIPSRNASWLTDPNAFEEPLERRFTCNAVTCLCPHQDGRNFYQVFGSWKIILCHTCGSNGIHRQCSLLISNAIWYCSVCSVVTGDPIIISGSGDSSSNVEVISFVAPPRIFNIHHVPVTSSQNRLLYRLSRNLSMSTTNSTFINIYHRNNAIILQSIIVSRFYKRTTTCDTINLTMDDDDDNGDNKGNNNANNNGHNNDENNGNYD